MIHICFSIHDENGNYSKYTGVAICSMLDHTKEKVRIHLFHDITLNEQNKKFLMEIVSQYNQEIAFYELDDEMFSNLECRALNCTIGTLFRLYITEILPSDIDKIIYMDSDIVVNLDIKELWSLDVEGYALAARVDAVEDERMVKNGWMVKDGLVEQGEYFNAGILLINMKYVRKKHDLFDESKKFFEAYPYATLADNDALNYIFRREVLYFETKYNTFTVFLRKNNEKLDKAIYHYAGDFVNISKPEYFDELFLSYLMHTPWGDKDLLAQSLQKMAYAFCNQLNILQKFLKRISRPLCKKIVFGASSIMYETIKTFIAFSSSIDYFVDNDKRLQGEKLDGVIVYNPNVLLHENRNEIAIIVLSKAYYKEIKKQLLDMGFNENEDFFDGRIFLKQNQGGYPLLK